MQKMFLWCRGLFSIPGTRIQAPDFMFISHWALQVGETKFEIDGTGAMIQQSDDPEAWSQYEATGKARKMELGITSLEADRVAQLALENYEARNFKRYGFFTRNCQAFVCSILLAIFEGEGKHFRYNKKMDTLSYIYDGPSLRVATIWRDICNKQPDNILTHFVNNADEASSSFGRREEARGVQKTFHASKYLLTKPYDDVRAMYKRIDMTGQRAARTFRQFIEGDPSTALTQVSNKYRSRARDRLKSFSKKLLKG